MAQTVLLAHFLCGFIHCPVSSLAKKQLLTHPEVIHDLDGLLKLDRDVHGNVVVEARTDRGILRQGRPVIFPA